MRVVELFGPTFQGEGRSTGRLCGFVRLWGCNLDCSWCDTPYTWDTTGKNGVAYDRAVESVDMTPSSIVEQVLDMGVDLVVVTGGEPLLQAAELVELIERFNEAGVVVEVETNGTRPPVAPHADVRWNVSPKLDHAMTTRHAYRPANLALFAGRDSSFKFVVKTVDDLDQITAIVDFVGADPSQVWVMPEGTTPAAIVSGLAAIADAVLARGWNLTPRLHVLCWGNTRGV